MNSYDVTIVGGGPAGLMAAISAAQQQVNVALIEKGDMLGRKLRISGGGRCNVTNGKPLDEIIKNVPGNGKFRYSTLHQFNNQDIIRFFEGLGIPLKEEDRGRIFPATDQAKTVVDALIRKMDKFGVAIITGDPVKDIVFKEHVHTLSLTSGKTIHTKTVILATGGCSMPKTGSTGDGYTWAKKAGHTITDLYPTAVPLTANNEYIKNHSLQGLSLRNITLTLLNPKGKKIIQEEGDMIFTHFGISGPAVLRISHYVSITRKKFNNLPLSLTIDLFPHQNIEMVEKDLQQLKETNEKKALKNALKNYVPDRLLTLLIQLIECEDTLPMTQISKEKIQKLALLMKNLPLTITGTLPLELATVTGGGVHIKEINPKTMESRLTKGLYFAGEIMDVHAHTGGYNITVAFSTGYTAGHSAALESLG